MKQYNNATIEKAHDVRTLRVCGHCGGLGNRDSMMVVRLPGKLSRPKVHTHARCYIKKNGFQAFLKLPKKEQDKVPMSDMGVRRMKALMKSRERVVIVGTRGPVECVIRT